MYLWREGDPCLKRCSWNLRRALGVRQFVMSVEHLAFVTTEGDTYLATLPKRKILQTTSGMKGENC